MPQIVRILTAHCLHFSLPSSVNCLHICFLFLLTIVEMDKTPIKQYNQVCLVCGEEPKAIRRVESSRIQEKCLKELLLKYGGINVERGVLCRKCYNKLENLHNKCMDFFNNCQQNISKTITNRKRMASSPATIMEKSFQKRQNGAVLVLSDNQRDTLGFTDQSHNREHSYAKTSKKSLNFESAINDDRTLSSKILDDQVTLDKSTDVEHTYAKNKTSKSEALLQDQLTYKTTSKNAIFHSIIPYISKNFQERGKSTHLSDQDKQKLLDTLSCQNSTIGDVAEIILHIQELKEVLIHNIVRSIRENVKELGKRKYFYISELMKKEPKDLKSLKWCDIVNEMMLVFPVPFQIMLGMILTPTDLKCYSSIQRAIPRLGMVYSLLMQGRNWELSRVQRTVSMILLDNICDQKVYDRLQTIGVCLSYSRTLEIADKVGNEFSQYILDLLEQGKRFRIVGDNINWYSHVRDYRMDNKDHMHHAFGSAIIVENLKFDDLDNTSPLNHYSYLNVSDFLPSLNDMKEIKFEYIVLMSRVAMKYIPFFKSFEDIIPQSISTPCQLELKTASKVIPLAVLFENEQYYQDVVKILSFYETFIVDNCQKAGVNFSDVKIHIGGDQLTRERFSGAKAMRAHHVDPAESFQHLGPITFELFHLFMNYLQLIFKTLYNDKSGGEMATLKSLQDRISRANVGENVKQHYDQDKEFFISCVDMHIVEALLEFFEMNDRLDYPQKHQPPPFQNALEKRAWYFKVMSEVLATTAFSESVHESTREENVLVEGHTFQITLLNGKTITLMKCAKPEKKSEDHVYNYACVMLEQGLLFKNLLDFAKMPERKRGIRLLKLAMIYFRSMNYSSKYAYEILRLLVHQQCILTEKGAHEEFYNLFVNTNGHYDGHIPCDLRMEYLVKEIKDHLKHMFSNKTETNIHNRTKAIAGIADICRNFDVQSGVIVRAKKHSHQSSFLDEMCMLNDLRKVRPFHVQVGRKHTSFRNISRSVVKGLDIPDFHNWIHHKKFEFAMEKGN